MRGNVEPKGKPMRGKRKIRVAVIGAGFAGRGHLKAYKSTELAEVIAICDVEKERAQAAAAEFGVPKVFTDYQELLQIEELDAVSVCVPNVFHMPVTVAALQVGKHVLCEKPLATSSAEAEKMVKTAEKTGRWLAMPLQFRLTGSSRLLKEKIENGELGEVHYVKSGILRQDAIPRGWFHVKKLAGGGAVLDLGSHAVDLAWWLMGRPKPVWVWGVTLSKLGPLGKGIGKWGVGFGEGKVDVEETGNALIKFEEDRALFVEVSWALQLESPRVMYCELFGTQGWASLFPSIRIKKEGGAVETPAIGEDQSPHVQFIQSLSQGVEPPISGRDGLEVIRMLDAIYQSARTGRAVRLG